MNSIIEVSNLSFSYQQDFIIDGMSFSANEGEFVAIVGENGVGKSTLLNLILSNLKASSGEIRLFDDLIEEDNHYMDIAYISQNSVVNYKTFPTTIEEVVKIHVRHLNLDVDIQTYLKMVGLDIHAKKTLSELSGGQLQRVGLVLALIKNAKLILLDEPTASIDKKFSKEFFQTLKNLSNTGKTIIMVTHDLEGATEFLDRAIQIKNGKSYELHEFKKNGRG